MTGSDGWLRVLRPLGLLALFVIVIRGLPDRPRPAAPDAGCDAAASGTADPATLERCLEIHPEDVELMMDLGAAREKAQQLDQAEALYRRALEVDPDDGDAHLRLGEMLLRRGDKAGAEREGVAALKVLPGSPAALGLLERARGAASPGTAP